MTACDLAAGGGASHQVAALINLTPGTSRRASRPRSGASDPHQRFHDLRHAYATLMLEDGEELAVVWRSLGHADLSTTADVYAHPRLGSKEPSAARRHSILCAPREAAGG